MAKIELLSSDTCLLVYDTKEGSVSVRNNKTRETITVKAVELLRACHTLNQSLITKLKNEEALVPTLAGR